MLDKQPHTQEGTSTEAARSSEGPLAELAPLPKQEGASAHNEMQNKRTTCHNQTLTAVT